MPESVLYTDLDSILDTRLAVIYDMDKEASALAVAGNYHVRINDVFEKIDYKEYRGRYKNRDKKILSYSMVTRITDLIIEFAETTYKDNVEDKDFTTPKLLLNTWPYDLNANEEKIILKGVVAKTKNSIDIEIIYKTYEEIDPVWVNDNVDMMCMYDYNIWLDTHSKNNNFNKTLCSEIVLLAPRVIFDKEIPNVEINDLFSDMKKFIEPFILIQYLPVYHFSIAKKIIRQTKN